MRFEDLGTPVPDPYVSKVGCLCLKEDAVVTRRGVTSRLPQVRTRDTSPVIVIDLFKDYLVVRHYTWDLSGCRPSPDAFASSP